MSLLSRPKPRMSVYDKPYWDFVQNRELRLQRCSSCGQFRYPPGPLCPQCLSEAADWAALSGFGSVLGWTVFHRQYFPELPIPYAVISVQTREGPLLIGNLVNAGGLKVEIDMPVAAVFEDVESPDGTWRICQWEPSR